MTEATPRFDRRHIDYREAFVLDVEMEAHGLECRTCAIAALRSTNDFCMKMKHMREAIKMAYEALPPYYKDRYKMALDKRFQHHEQVLRDAGALRG